MHHRNGRPTLATVLCLAVPAIGLAVIFEVMAAGGESVPEAVGELDASQILARCDEFHYFYDDAHMKVRSVLVDGEGKTDELGMEVWEKGEKRLIVFSSPPEVSGMAVLVKDPSTIYVYEPEFNKVRRIASSAKKQSLMGSDYSFDEMAMKKLGLDYDPVILSEDEGSAVLELIAKPGKDKAWPRLELVVDKTKHFMASKIRFFDASGKKVKTETRKKLATSGEWTYPSVLVMVDHGRDHSTTNIVESVTYNKGLPDSMFTKRYLIRED